MGAILAIGQRTTVEFNYFNRTGNNKSNNAQMHMAKPVEPMDLVRAVVSWTAHRAFLGSSNF